MTLGTFGGLFRATLADRWPALYVVGTIRLSNEALPPPSRVRELGCSSGRPHWLALER